MVCVKRVLISGTEGPENAQWESVSPKVDKVWKTLKP